MLCPDVFGHPYRGAVLVHVVDCFWPRPEYEPFYTSFEFRLTETILHLHRWIADVKLAKLGASSYDGHLRKT